MVLYIFFLLRVGGDQVQILCHEKGGWSTQEKGGGHEKRMVNVHVPLCHPWFRGFQPPMGQPIFIYLFVLKGAVSSRSEQTFDRNFWNRCTSLRLTQ